MKRCYIYLLNGLSDWEISFITAEINSKRYLSEDVELIMIGNSLEPIQTMGGITIYPDIDINCVDFKDGDILILPGSDLWHEKENSKVLGVVSELINKDIIIAAICGATLALAQNGLLDNRKHTSNAIEVLNMFCPDYKGASYYVDNPVVVNDNLITATGLAPLEFSYEVFKKMDIMKNETLNAWYQLYKTRDSKYFHILMDSLN